MTLLHELGWMLSQFVHVNNLAVPSVARSNGEQRGEGSEVFLVLNKSRTELASGDGFVFKSSRGFSER